MTTTKRLTMITNLDHVTIDRVVLFAHAIVLDEASGWSHGSNHEMNEANRFQVTGMYTEASLPVFSVRVATMDPIFTEEKPPERRGMVALNRHGQLDFGDGLVIKIGTARNGLPFDFETFEVSGVTDWYSDVWPQVMRKCKRYWDAPNFPVMRYLPITL